MREIYKNLFVGNEIDYEDIVKDQPNWYVIHACKEPYHRALLGYKGRGAPKDNPEYLFAIRDNILYLNLVDAEESIYISEIIIDEALKFIDLALENGNKCLVHCNLGESRSPSIGLLYLISKSLILGNNMKEIESNYRLVYPEYNPKNGIRGFIESNWEKYTINFKMKEKEIEGGK